MTLKTKLGVAHFGLLTILCAPFSCTEKPIKESVSGTFTPVFLPFEKLELVDMSEFDATSANWVIGGGAFSNRKEPKHLDKEDGTGVLLNLMTDHNKQNLFTKFEHIDIDLEVDIMMPKQSNSGIYFQGRYEIQLFDSWGKERAGHSDMGGIYQRWDSTKPQGQEGYEGHTPIINAAYAPGLWQHLSVSFKAPRFDAQGNKIANALFEKVALNGYLIHQHVELNGPTRGAPFVKEALRGPLMIQGDHGPVAFKNFKYKLYDGTQVTLSDLVVSEYQSVSDTIKDCTKIQPKYKQSTDSLTYTNSKAPQEFMLVFEGKIMIPRDGDYLFKLEQHRKTSGLFILEKDTVMDIEIEKERSKPRYHKAGFKSGGYPFTLVYNHPKKIWGDLSSQLTLFVEGPGIANQALHAPSSEKKTDSRIVPIRITPTNKAVTQRSFVNHMSDKLTHCISVGTPQGIHYSVDMLTGSIVRMWSGRFIDVTSMWHSRGNAQVSIALDGPVIELFNGPIARVPDRKNSRFKSHGYELDESGIPLFNYKLGDMIIRDKTVPDIAAGRGLKRSISISGKPTNGWCKLAEGSKISKLPGGAYGVDDKKFYLILDQEAASDAVVYKSGKTQELLIPLKGEQMTVDLEIIW